MTVAKCPLSFHGLLRRAFDQVGGDQSVVVILPRVSINWIHGVLNPNRDDSKRTHLRFEDAQVLVEGGAICLAEDLARRCGMQLVPIGASDASRIQLMGHMAAMMGKCGEAAQAVTDAVADGIIDAGEERRIIENALHVTEAAHGLAKAVKGYRESKG